MEFLPNNVANCCESFSEIAASSPSQHLDSRGLLRPLVCKLPPRRVVIVRIVEARHHRTPKQRKLPIAHQSSTLPHTRRNQDLDMFAGRQITSKAQDRRAAVWIQLQHLHWITQVEVEHLVGVEHVHL